MDTSAQARKRPSGCESSSSDEEELVPIPKVPGRLVSVELEDFMCHDHMQLKFNVKQCNCFYIVGPNGSGKSAIFAGLNIGLGGRGRANDRGDNVQAYIKEGKSCAKTRIVLTNEGPSSHPDYGKEIVIERMITSSKSQFTLKSRNGRGGEKVVSRKKIDLDALLHHFSIELDNPLSWLSQDRSRQFLQEMKPEKLYEMFVITTEQAITQHFYDQALGYAKGIEKAITDCEEQKEKRKREYEEMVARHKAAKRIEESKKEMGNLSSIRDIDEKCADQQSKLKKLASMRKDFEKKKADLEEEEAESKASAENLRQQLVKLKEEATIANRDYQKVKENQIKCQRYIGENKRERLKVDAELESLGKATRQFEQELAKHVGEGQFERNYKEEEQRLNREMSELQSKQFELDDKLGDAKGAEARCDGEFKTAHNKLTGADYAIRRLKEKADAVRNEERMCEAAKLNRMTVFGFDIPKVIEIIEQNEHRFGVKPIGPIGSLIKLRDSRWAAPVELVLRKLAGNFICDSAEDRRKFEQLCRSRGIGNLPSITVTKFSREKFDTVQNEPPRKYATILRMIDISNPTVFNTLVDQLSIENKLLIEGVDEARLLMRDNPPLNAREAVTLNCSRVYAAANGKPYRFFNGERYTPRFLVEGSLERNFKEELIQIARETEVENQLRNEKNEDVRKADAALKKARDQVTLLHREKKATDESSKALEKNLEELHRVLSSGDLIQNLNEALRENRRALQSAREKKERLEKEAKQLEEQAQQVQSYEATAQNKKKELLTKCEQMDTSVHESTKRRAENEEGIRKMTEKIARCDSLKQKTDDILETLADERQKKQIKCNEDKKKFSPPQGFSDPPDFSLIPATNDLTKELKNVEANIRMEEQRALQQREVPNAEDIKQWLYRYAEEYRVFRERHKFYRKISQAFMDEFNAHFNDFKVFRFNCPLALSRAFEQQMSMKQYTGSLTVDHEHRLISISVETHKKNSPAPVSTSTINVTSAAQAQRSSSRGLAPQPQQEARASVAKKRMAQDMRGLSGGERSYTTACFVMALWKCVQSPFRCLDEFDIFMDHYNRRVVIEMLMEMAAESKDTQFLFFTPQGVSELGNRDNIEVFALKKQQDT